jgi:uncharacterized coiled-coil protein SlyX
MSTKQDLLTELEAIARQLHDENDEDKSVVMQSRYRVESLEGTIKHHEEQLTKLQVQLSAERERLKSCKDHVRMLKERRHEIREALDG